MSPDLVTLDLLMWLEGRNCVVVGGRFNRCVAQPPVSPASQRGAMRRWVMGAARRELGLPDVIFRHDPSGALLWPAGQRGSLSHWGDLSVCMLMLGESADVGVDVEGFADDEARRAIRQETLSRREAARLDGAPVRAGVAEALVFSAKESFFKAVYPRVGQRLDFDAAEFVALSGKTLTLRVTRRLGNGLEEDELRPLGFRLFDGFVLTWMILPV